MIGLLIFSTSSWVNFGNSCFPRKLCLLWDFHVWQHRASMHVSMFFKCHLSHISGCIFSFLIVFVPSFLSLVTWFVYLLVFSNNNSWLYLLFIIVCVFLIVSAFLVPNSLFFCFSLSILPPPFPRFILLLFYLACWVECLGEALHFHFGDQGLKCM